MLKVMTFNIRYGTAEDGLNHWQRRRGAAMARIRAADPDLLGLQECRADEQAEYVKSALPDYSFWGLPRGGDDATGLEMAPTLWRTSAFEALRRGMFWLSETPDVPASISWNSTFARVVTWVELRHRASNRALMFACTHFDTTATAIAGAAHVLREWVEAQGDAPLIVVGDFNAGQNSAAFAQLAAGGRLAEAFRLAHPGSAGPGATFHGYGQAGGHEAIDWILISPHLAVTTAAVDRHQVEGLYPSDHYPVTASLRWAETPGSSGA
ncbi:MAG: endonuclease/exonuclease/phosphatase family protein [Anaerolineales bacterium]|nr:endonuclease/exonuclease/phosphatase family protein [Anaerolineales bacterium]